MKVWLGCPALVAALGFASCSQPPLTPASRPEAASAGAERNRASRGPRQLKIQVSRDTDPSFPPSSGEATAEEVINEIGRQVVDGKPPTAGLFEGWTIKVDRRLVGEDMAWFTIRSEWRDAVDVMAKVLRCRVRERPGKVLELGPTGSDR